MQGTDTLARHRQVTLARHRQGTDKSHWQGTDKAQAQTPTDTLASMLPPALDSTYVAGTRKQRALDV
jgi:hypothetical protein